jgi:hypothetical protein
MSRTCARSSRCYPYHFLVIILTKDGSIEELYNGPGALAWTNCSKQQKNGQSPIGVSKLRHSCVTYLLNSDSCEGSSNAMPKPNGADVLESAITLVQATLALNILEAHKRDVINGMLWSITQARGKYTTRFRSTAALHAPPDTKLQHEHVITRKALTDAIMREPHRARELLRTAIGCVVTRDEHQRLTQVTREQPHLHGWERYTAAYIDIVDTDA